MRKLHCSDAMMAAACAEIAAGLTDADLGSNLYKKRIPIEGRGKSGGLRTIIASRFNGRCLFWQFGKERSCQYS